jgi:hypothetical protein
MSRLFAIAPLAGRLLFNAALAGGLVLADALQHNPIGLLARAFRQGEGLL